MLSPPATSRAKRAAADLAGDLRPALLRLSRQLRREAQRFGVSALDAQLLAMISKSPGVGLSELARFEQMTKPAMSAHVKRLEAAGWIKRDETHADKRRVGLVITRTGARTLEAIRRQRDDWLAARLATLSEEEFAALSRALAALNRLAGEGA